MNERRALVWSERPELIPELAAACQGAEQVEALVFGREPPTELTAYVQRTWWAPMEAVDAAQRAAVIAQAMWACTPGLVVAAATRTGIETLAHLAQSQGLACAHACLSLAWESEGVAVTRPRYGRFVASERLEGHPALLTVPPRRFSPRPRQEPGEVSRLEAALPAPRLKVLSRRLRKPSAMDVAAARTVVSVGRGLRNEEDLVLIERLARALHASVGASRPLTDHLQWLPVDVKVGLSGRTVRPELYVACGISGQCEHIVGMRESRVVVSINLDPAAPIHAEADYAVIGDLYAFIPALLKVLGQAG